MADLPSNSKPRQPRLRASCDGCFTAKVKCSKARPICSRCLACGLECRYSPSSRAGKPKPQEKNANPQTGPNHHMVRNLDDGYMMHHCYISPVELYGIESGWDTPPNSSPSMIRYSGGTQGLSDDNLSGHSSETPIYSMAISPWASVAEASTLPFNEMLMDPVSLGPDEPFSHSEPSMSLASSWESGTSGPPNSSPTPTNMGSKWLPSLASTPSIPNRHQYPVVTECSCFNVCIQSFRELHSASGGSVLLPDIIILLSMRAVESCETLLLCPTCTRHPGISTTIMFVATILSTAACFYRTAAQMYLEDTTGGAPDSPYINGDTVSSALQEAEWLQPAAYMQEMGRLREVFSRFCDVCADLPGDAEVNRVMVGYVCRSLSAAMEAFKKLQTTWYP